MIDELVAVPEEFSKYKNAHDARKILQRIIVEARTMRKTVNDERKAASKK